ncbi:MAG: hypothetical protein H6860_04955 [Rhodospirillales bacterium]|nr:hypothetical protein [Alphaproteobacteria bacterium]MCB9981731.1 hypothetical protein [Rhodospirillales bacterium]
MDFKLFCRRSGLIFVEALAAGVVLAVVVVCVLGWRLLSAPLDMEFARPYVQEALRDEQSGIHVSMDKIVLFWPDVREPLLLGLQGASVYGPDGRVVASIDEAALGLNKAHLLMGQIRPEGLVLKRPSLRLIRNADNSFDIGVADMKTYGPVAPKEEEGAQGDYIEQILGVLAGDRNGPVADSLLSELRSFEIEEASLLVDDRVLALSWVLPRADIVIERVDGALRSKGIVDLPAESGAAPRLKFTAELGLASEAVDLDAVLENFDLSLLGQKIPELEILKTQDVLLNAQFKARIDKGMKLQRADLTVLSEAGALNIAELSAEPVAYKDLGVLAHYTAQNGQVDLKKVQVTISGVKLEGNADLRLSEAGAVNGPVRLEIERLAQSAIAPLWPAALAEDNSKEWIVDKLGDGIFSNVYAQGDLEVLAGADGRSVDLKNLVAGFEFDGMSVNYRAPLKPVTDAKGKGTFNLNSETLRVDIESAKVMGLAISEADVELVNIIEAGKGQADINLKLQGPAKSVFTYIRDEPIGVNSEIDVANVKGQADLQVNISLPTKSNIKIEDVDVNVRGALREAVLPNVVRGLALSEGPFDVSVKDNALRVKGKGRLGDQPIVLDYHEYLSAAGKPYAMQVKAALLATPALRDQFGMDLSSFLEGPVFADVTYTEYAGGRADAVVAADLTPAKMFVDPFDYEKQPGVKGETTLRAVLRNGELKEIVDLKGSAPSLSLESSVLRFRQKGEETELAGGKVSRFTLNETVARLEFEVGPSGQAKIVMDGPFLDARPFLDDEKEEGKPYDAPPMLISVAVDRMRTTDEETVQYAKLYIDIDGLGKINQMEMDGIAGAGDIYLRYKPDGSGKRVFRLEADDAGATLKAFDLYKGVRGGKLVIYGEPIHGVFDRNLIGVAEMTNFKVVDAPALAQLLGAMSLPGLMASLNGDEGLSFTKMEANFDWLYRPSGSLLVFKDGRTSGNSLGLTFDGTFDNAAHTMDVTGTIIPLSGINKVIGDIPLVGDILTGGTGALIAATYTMKGSSEDPKVSVNPLSVLTPGILRRVLFE